MKTTSNRRELLRSDLGDDQDVQDLVNDLDRALSLLGRLAGLQYRVGPELIACYDQLQRDVCEFLREE